MAEADHSGPEGGDPGRGRAADDARTATLEAFADTIIPGEKRYPGDRAVAGAAPGGGAVAAGALTLLEGEEGGFAPLLDGAAQALDWHAAEYAGAHALALEPHLPPFVALPFAHRTALVQRLTHPEHPDRELWNGLAIFSCMAFDSAAHMHTVDAISQKHIGLTTMGFVPPDSDGLWRFPEHSYGRQLARLHPDTSPSGSLA